MDSLKRTVHARKGFTLLEILLVISAIGILAAIVIIAIDPTRQLAQAHNSQRAVDAKTISNAIVQYTLDHGAPPPGLNSTLQVIGNGNGTCNIDCGQKFSVRPQNQELAQFIGRIKHDLLDGLVVYAATSTSGWVSPTGDQDPGNQWSDRSLGYDNNLYSYATNAYGGTGWGQYIVFTLPGAIYSSAVRINTDYIDSLVQNVQVDVYKDGAWVNVFDGGSEAVWNDKWVTISFPPGMVSQARFRYNYLAGGYYFWLYEFQFYQAAPSITAPVCGSTYASAVTENSATLHGVLSDDGGAPTDARFVYGPTSGYGSATSWLTPYATGDTVSTPIGSLSNASTYHFQLQLRNSAGTTNCPDTSFSTKPASIGWTLATGYSDPTGLWENPTQAFDNDVTSYARTYHNMNSGLESPYLYLTIPASKVNAVEFYARGGADVDSATVDVLEDGVWTTVFNGPFADSQFVQVSFPGGVVSQARIKFTTPNSAHGFYWQLNEFDFYKTSISASSNCLDLASYLVPTYLAAMPTDPLSGTQSNTHYAVDIDPSNGRVSVFSCDAELGDSYIVTR